MKKIAIASNIVFDIIVDIDGNTIESLGGPACYGSIIAKTFGFDTILATKVGRDIHQKNDLLIKHGISLENSKIDIEYLTTSRSEEHTSELQSRQYLVCRLLLEKKKQEE